MAGMLTNATAISSHTGRGRSKPAAAGQAAATVKNVFRNPGVALAGLAACGGGGGPPDYTSMDLLPPSLNMQAQKFDVSITGNQFTILLSLTDNRALSPLLNTRISPDMFVLVDDEGRSLRGVTAEIQENKVFHYTVQLRFAYAGPTISDKNYTLSLVASRDSFTDAANNPLSLLTTSGRLGHVSVTADMSPPTLRLQTEPLPVLGRESRFTVTVTLNDGQALPSVQQPGAAAFTLEAVGSSDVIVSQAVQTIIAGEKEALFLVIFDYGNRPETNGTPYQIAVNQRRVFDKAGNVATVDQQAATITIVNDRTNPTVTLIPEGAGQTRIKVNVSDADPYFYITVRISDNLGFAVGDMVLTSQYFVLQKGDSILEGNLISDHVKTAENQTFRVRFKFMAGRHDDGEYQFGLNQEISPIVDKAGNDIMVSGLQQVTLISDREAPVVKFGVGLWVARPGRTLGVTVTVVDGQELSGQALPDNAFELHDDDELFRVSTSVERIRESLTEHVYRVVFPMPNESRPEQGYSFRFATLAEDAAGNMLAVADIADVRLVVENTPPEVSIDSLDYTVQRSGMLSIQVHMVDDVMLRQPLGFSDDSFRLVADGQESLTSEGYEIRVTTTSQSYTLSVSFRMPAEPAAQVGYRLQLNPEGEPGRDAAGNPAEVARDSGIARITLTYQSQTASLETWLSGFREQSRDTADGYDATGHIGDSDLDAIAVLDGDQAGYYSTDAA